MSVFRTFFNCTAEVGTMQGSRRYEDDAVTLQKEGTYRADFQPYNGGLSEKEYGVSEDVTARIYTEPTGGVLKAGKVAVISDTLYDILYVEAWEMGDVALLRKRNQSIEKR